MTWPCVRDCLGGAKLELSNNYRPQRSWAKVIFSQACVKNSVHRGEGCLSQCMLGYTPQEKTPSGSRHPPGADTPLEQTPRKQTPPEQTPPISRHPPEQTPQKHTPPGSRPPPGKQTAAYRQRAAGTHPTGMHSCWSKSCFYFFMKIQYEPNLNDHWESNIWLKMVYNWGIHFPVVWNFRKLCT